MKTILIAGLLFMGLDCFAIDDKFFKALGAVESSNNPKAFNSKELAIGKYQIRPAYFEDAKQFDKSLRKYRHEDCYDPAVAKRVVIAYMRRYCPGGNYEEMAKIHNGGPSALKKTGQAKSNLAIYWSKIQKHL